MFEHMAAVDHVEGSVGERQPCEISQQAGTMMRRDIERDVVRVAEFAEQAAEAALWGDVKNPFFSSVEQVRSRAQVAHHQAMTFHRTADGTLGRWSAVIGSEATQGRPAAGAVVCDAEMADAGQQHQRKSLAAGCATLSFSR